MDLRQLPKAKFQEPEVSKRPRDEETAALIDELLGNEQTNKKLKKGAPDLPPGHKGKTLAQIEDEEGGPVKESLVGMARTKRAVNRKDKGKTALEDADFGTLEDVADAEEEVAEQEPDQEPDEVPLEPFNLHQEREEGHFDEDGTYVENKRDEDDAWLDSVDVKPVSLAVRKRVEERARMMAAAEDAPPMGEMEMAALKGEMAGLMQAGETVTRAIKRLGGDRGRRGPGGKRGKQQQQQHEEAGPAPGADPQAFGRLTEIADSLLNSGEFDIYSSSKELLAREAAVYGAPTIAQQATQAGEKDMFADEDEDMFGGTEAPAAAAAGAAVTGSSAVTQGASAPESTVPPGAPPAAGGPPPSAASDSTSTPAATEEVDYSSWPVKELRRFLSERGQDTTGIVEKDDLVARVREAAAQGPDGGVPDAPAGYAFDPSSSYYYSAESGMYWDPSSGAFCHATTGQWYNWDAGLGQFVAFPTAS